jgi:TonB-linked SusC/RagA family outer membrane protein
MIRPQHILFLFFLIISPYSLIGQARTITGKVIGADDQLPLIGVNVQVKGTTIGTITDFEGNYSIELNVAQNQLEFSYIGYKTHAITINAQSVINIVLQADVAQLEEVVIIGYGKVRKSDLTGSVSSVKAKDIVKIPSSSPEQALQGKVAGVRVTSNSGAPGAAPTVRVRGVGTFGNPDPIFIVDGIILDDITFLNAADIASIEVLKDASSTAIYGSRGANGVIIITTKSGANDEQASIQLSGGYDVQTIQKTIDVLDARSFATVLNRIRPGSFNNLDLLENTDWQSAVYQELAPIYNGQLSVSGGGKKSKYYVGLGYFKQEGIIPKSSFERYNLKINNEYQLSKHLKLGHRLTFSKFSQVTAPNIVASTLRAWPTDAPFEEDSNTFFANRGNGNPLAAIAFNNNERDGLRTVGNAYANIDFLNNFTFRTSFGVDLQNVDAFSFVPIFFVSPQQQNDETRLNKSRSSNENWLWENTLNYHLTKGAHSINALIGYTAQEDNSEVLSGQGRNLLRDDILFLSNDLTDIRLANNAAKKSLVSYLFRANYVFQDKYLLTATFRRDGSSVFDRENRWGNFPSFALGWRLSNEAFFHSRLISNLKLRASWGIVGNDKVAVNDRFTLIQQGTGAVFGENETLNPGSTFGISGNPLIRWEEAKQTNIGLELGMLEDKLTLELDYYQKETQDILIDLPLPGHFGNGSFAFVKFNAANVRNRGLELNLNWRERRGDFRYDIGLIGSTVQNEVLKLGEDTEANNFLPLGNLGNGQNVKRVAIDQPIGYFYGYQVEGIFQNESELSLPKLPAQGVGDFRYSDINGDGVITSEDRTFIGSPLPDFIFGINLSFAYKGIGVSADFQGELGKEIYDGKDAVRAGQYNYQTGINNAWDGAGSSSTEPRPTAGGINYSQSDWFIEDGSFFRLRSLTLSYELPSSLLQKLRMQKANVFIRGTNVFTLTKYSGYTPEIGGNIAQNGIDSGVYPVTSVYGAGINLTF